MAVASNSVKDLSAAFEDALRQAGLHGALRFLNTRTPHRFTGVYRYDGGMLRNVGLFDQFNPDVPGGDDAPIDNTFCSLVPGFGGALAFADASRDRRVSHVVTPVVSYCGVQLFDAEGVPRGTLCHFDLKPCEPQTSEMQLLATLAPTLQRTLIEASAAPH